MQCNECGATISDKAADCPQCGASIRDVSPDEKPDTRGGAVGSPVDEGATDGDAESGAGDEGPIVPDSSPTGPESAGMDDESGESDGHAGRETTDRMDAGGETTDVPDTDEEPAAVPDAGGDQSASDAPPTTDTGPSTGSQSDDVETGWEAAGPPPERQETTAAREEQNVGAESRTGGQEPTTAGSSDPDDRQTGSGGDVEFGGEPGGGDRSPEAAEPAGSDEPSSDGPDPVEQIKELPLLTAPLAGVVTAVVLAVLSTVLAVLTPNTGPDPVTVGATVLLDLHFATRVHLPVGLLTQFDTARPPNATLGILYLLPPLFLYTAAKFVTAYNIDEETLTPVAAAGGSLVAVGYFPAVVVALFLAPGGPSSNVKLLPAILLAGVFYPVFFGTVGGLVAGALSGSERRIGTLYGVVGFFLITVGAFVLTVPAIQLSDVGPLPQIHASLFTVVAVNGLRLGDPDIGALVLLAYPMVAFVVSAAGFLRAWNAEDVDGPLRGVAKGLSPAVTYVTLLGLLAALVPLLADPWVARELGLSPNGEALVRSLVRTNLFTVGQYVTAVFVGALLFPVFLGGLGGTIAGTARHVLSDENQ